MFFGFGQANAVVFSLVSFESCYGVFRCWSNECHDVCPRDATLDGMTMDGWCYCSVARRRSGGGSMASNRHGQGLVRTPASSSGTYIFMIEYCSR